MYYIPLVLVLGEAKAGGCLSLGQPDLHNGSLSQTQANKQTTQPFRYNFLDDSRIKVLGKPFNSALFYVNPFSKERNKPARQNTKLLYKS